MLFLVLILNPISKNHVFSTETSRILVITTAFLYGLSDSLIPISINDSLPSSGAKKRVVSKYSARVFDKIDDIGKDSIDAISDDPFFTYGWFKTLEKQKDFLINPFYITVYDNSKLVAFAPCFLDKRDEYFLHGLYYLPFMKEILLIGNKLRLWQKHLLICYSPCCFRSKIMIKHSHSKREILSIVNRKIAELCKKERILFSSFSFVSEHDDRILFSLKKSGYFQLPWKSTFYVDINWSNFEEYLADLKYKDRKNIRREIRKSLENGIIVGERPNLDCMSEKLADLSSKLFQKYNQGIQPLFGKSFFQSLSENARDSARLFAAEKNGKLIGFLLLMRHKDILDCFNCGFDYNFLSNTDFAYFSLVYYFPIEWAIRENISRIYYRISADNVKLRRGCSQEQIFSNLKCHNKLLNIFFTFYAKVKYKNCALPV